MECDLHNEPAHSSSLLAKSHEPRTDLYSDLIGKQFAYGGRGPFEYDCYGLCIEIYRRMEIELPEFGSSPSSSWIHRHILEAQPLFDELKKPEPFCLVTFKTRPPYTSHIGVVLEHANQFIHIQQKSCVVIERLDALMWKNRITGFYSYRLSSPNDSIGDPGTGV